MAQVYAVFYNDKGDLIVARKNLKSYFFHTDGGKIYPDGFPLNGAGQYCFPGGGLEGVDTVKGALKELLEETNVAINTEVFRPTPAAFHGEEKVKGVTYHYYGVYFRAPGDHEDPRLNRLPDLLSAFNRNLKIGSDAAAAIASGKFKGNYKQLMETYEDCPADNELAGCAIVNIKDINNYFKKDDKVTGWFYSIVQHLKTKIESGKEVIDDSKDRKA